MNNTRWPLPLENKLRELWASSLSAADIGRVLGFGRNAVLGKVHRLKLAHRNNPGNRKPRTVREPKVRRVAVVKPRPVKNADAENSTHNSKHPLSIVQPPRNLGLMDLTDAACRFPIGDGPFTFCGHDTQPGSPYCSGHHALCYQPADERLSRGYVNYTVRHAA